MRCTCRVPLASICTRYVRVAKLGRRLLLLLLLPPPAGLFVVDGVGEQLERKSGDTGGLEDKWMSGCFLWGIDWLLHLRS